MPSAGRLFSLYVNTTISMLSTDSLIQLEFLVEMICMGVVPSYVQTLEKNLEHVQQAGFDKDVLDPIL